MQVDLDQMELAAKQKQKQRIIDANSDFNRDMEAIKRMREILGDESDLMPTHRYVGATDQVRGWIASYPGETFTSAEIRSALGAYVGISPTSTILGRLVKNGEVEHVSKGRGRNRPGTYRKLKTNTLSAEAAA